MADLRVGLVGAGMVARHHVIAWSRCKTASLVAIADPNLDAATRLSQEQTTVHSSLQELLRETDVDVIDIAAPVGAHAGLVREAVAAGLPVLCQKPLAPTVAEAERLVSDLPPDARVMLHENWRWRSTYRALKAYLSERPKPESFVFRCESSGLCPSQDGTYPALERQPFLADLDRLIVFELLGHHIDVLSFLFGDVEIVGTETRRRCPAVRGEDFASIELVAGGVPGRLTGDFAAPGAPPRPRDTLLLDGKTVVDDWSVRAGGDVRHWNDNDGYQESYDACIAHFASCTLSGEPYETPLSHGVTLLRSIKDVYAMSND